MTAGSELITRLERAGAAAWPALETRVLGPWLLRAAQGVTRRANSVLPCHAPGPRDWALPDVVAALAEVESYYAAKASRPIFQMSPAAVPTALDDHLASAGYDILDFTEVRTVELDRLLEFGVEEVVISNSPTPEWLELYGSIWNLSDSRMAVIAAILARTPDGAGFGMIRSEGRAAAIGMAVPDAEWVGFFCMGTAAEGRGRGFARRMLGGLAGWSHAAGCRQVYLQVAEENHAAIRLYDRSGFEVAYRYWYRAPVDP